MSHAKQALREKKFDEAVAHLARSIAAEEAEAARSDGDHPVDHRLFSLRSAAFYSRAVAAVPVALDDLRAALCDGERCVALCAAWWEGHYRCGVALARLARFDEALAAFDAGLRLGPREDHCDVLRTARRATARSAVQARALSAGAAGEVPAKALSPAESRARALDELIAEADDYAEVSLASPVHRAAAARSPEAARDNTLAVGAGGRGPVEAAAAPLHRVDTETPPPSAAALYRSLASAHDTVARLRSALEDARAASAEMTVAAGAQRSTAAAQRAAHAAALSQSEASLAEAARVHRANAERIAQLEGAHDDAAASRRRIAELEWELGKARARESALASASRERAESDAAELAAALAVAAEAARRDGEERGARVATRKLALVVQRYVALEKELAAAYSFVYRYIPRESCSQFDLLPLTSLTISDTSRSRRSSQRHGARCACSTRARLRRPPPRRRPRPRRRRPRRRRTRRRTRRQTLRCARS